MDKSTLPQNILEQIEIRKKYLNTFRGCLIGGAIGDALGYPVEFMNVEDIFEKFGPSGITSYQLNRENGLALISDDTQMSLFTANGLLVGQTKTCLRGISAQPRYYVYLAYLDWLETQRGIEHGKRVSWLSDIQALWSCRAPGATCLDALSSGKQGSTEQRINHSKGCGGVMRVAPVGLMFQNRAFEEADIEGAEIAALTHSHSLGFMPAAFLTHVIKAIAEQQGQVDLYTVISDAKEMISKLFSERKHLGVFMDIIDRAVEYSRNNRSDAENIPLIGAGWCGDEALAIALYCSLRHERDFSGAVIAAVNHSGDSDSTGAITGNIVGAIVGYDEIDSCWKQNLELRDTILELADDLCFGCPMRENVDYKNDAWLAKYSR